MRNVARAAGLGASSRGGAELAWDCAVSRCRPRHGLVLLCGPAEVPVSAISSWGCGGSGSSRERARWRHGDQANGTSGLECLPALAGGTGVGAQRAEHVLRRRVVDDDHLSPEVEVGEVVVVLGGEIQPVADEDQWRIDDGAGRNMRAEGNVFGEVKLGAGAESNRRFLGVDGNLIERHWLEIPVAPCGFEADGLELLLDVADSGVIPRSAGAAALEVVGGKVLDMRPPGVAEGGPVGRGRLRGESKGQQGGGSGEAEMQLHR